jgi:hypothetical protein
MQVVGFVTVIMLLHGYTELKTFFVYFFSLCADHNGVTKQGSFLGARNSSCENFVRLRHMPILQTVREAAADR